MRVVAFDSKPVKRSDFSALLGVGITIHDYPDFVKEYNAIFESVFKELGVKRNKSIYKSSELLSIFYSRGIDIITTIAEKLIQKIDFIDIYYSYFIDEKGKPIRIGVYWEEELTYVNGLEFLDIIQNAFSALCCHSYLKYQTAKMDTVYFIDDCPNLNPSLAIETVIRHPQTKFLFKGDQVNYAVSCADILSKYVDQSSQKNGIYLNKFLIERMGFDPKVTKTTFIGPQWLFDIKPSKKVIIDINHKRPHPIFFFFLDNDGPFKGKSKEIIENSVIFRLTTQRATELNGTVKFFEAKDQNYITNEDFLVKSNESSEKKTKELVGYGCPAKIIDISFFYT